MSCPEARLQVHRSLLLETRGFAAAGPRRARTAHTFRLPHLPPPAASHPDHQAALAASMNAYYLLYAGALVFMMQAGFAMLCAGSLRMKNIKVRVLRQRARGPAARSDRRSESGCWGWSTPSPKPPARARTASEFRPLLRTPKGAPKARRRHLHRRRPTQPGPSPP